MFKAVYDDESQRYAQLASRAQLYLTLIGIYLGAIGFKLKDLSEFAITFGVPLWLFFVAGVLVAVAMLSTIIAIRVRDYEAPCDLINIIEEFSETPPLDEAFPDYAMPKKTTGRKKPRRKKRKE